MVSCWENKGHKVKQSDSIYPKSWLVVFTPTSPSCTTKPSTISLSTFANSTQTRPDQATLAS